MDYKALRDVEDVLYWDRFAAWCQRLALAAAAVCVALALAAWFIWGRP